MEYKTILVPIDGSESSAAAVRTARSLPETAGFAGIPSCRQSDGHSCSRRGNVRGTVIPVLEDAVDAGKQILNHALDCTPDGLTAKGHCISGDDAAQTILDSAERIAADLIIIGSRGIGGFKAAVLGSVSGYVLSHANCPVVVV